MLLQPDRPNLMHEYIIFLFHRYNSSMFEIKRLNKLWSNQSLYCKSEVLIPIFNASTSDTSISYSDLRLDEKNRLDRLSEEKNSKKQREDESLEQLLKRIDLNMKKTKKAVMRLHQRVQSEHNNN